MDRLEQSGLWRIEWELAGIWGAEEQQAEAWAWLELDVVWGGVTEVPVCRPGQMGKEVSWDTDRRGGVRPGAGRGPLTDPMGPQPSRDPRLCMAQR